MYISKPVRAIKGIVYLNNRHTITDWESQYGADESALSRIKEYELYVDAPIFKCKCFFISQQKKVNSQHLFCFLCFFRYNSMQKFLKEVSL